MCMCVYMFYIYKCIYVYKNRWQKLAMAKENEKTTRMRKLVPPLPSIHERICLYKCTYSYIYTSLYTST